MRLRYIFLIALIVLSMKAISQIEGDVRDKTDDPITKAKIFAIDSTNRTVDSVMSDENGFYRFSNLRPGEYLIETRAIGFEIKQYKNIIARARISTPGVGKDISNATRLQIILSSIKNLKQ